MNFLNVFRRGPKVSAAEAEPQSAAPLVPVPDAVEDPDLEKKSTQHNLCYWASRDVPHTQLRFLSLWTDKQTGESVVGVKILGTSFVRYWVYGNPLPPGAAQNPDAIRAVLHPLFINNGAPNSPFFPALPTLFQVADKSLLPISTVKSLVMLLAGDWDGADLRNFNEIILTKLPTEQALRRRLGREWMTKWGDLNQRVIPPMPADLETWWAIITDPNHLAPELTLCSRLSSQWNEMHSTTAAKLQNS